MKTSLWRPYLISIRRQGRIWRTRSNSSIDVSAGRGRVPPACGLVAVLVRPLWLDAPCLDLVLFDDVARRAVDAAPGLGSVVLLRRPASTRHARALRDAAAAEPTQQPRAEGVVGTLERVFADVGDPHIFQIHRAARSCPALSTRKLIGPRARHLPPRAGARETLEARTRYHDEARLHVGRPGTFPVRPRAHRRRLRLALAPPGAVPERRSVPRACGAVMTAC